MDINEVLVKNTTLNKYQSILSQELYIHSKFNVGMRNQVTFPL